MRIVFVTDEFKLRTPVQQLLDRFLIGYPVSGGFYKPDCRLTLVAPERNSGIEQRMKDFGLQWQSKIEEDADAAMIFTAVPAQSARWPRSYVYPGIPPLIPETGIVGTGVRGAWLLPEITPPKQPTRGLIIVQGTYPVAELEALDALLPLIWREGAKVSAVTHLAGKDFWDVLKREFWPLVKSAISRSDSPQGDALRDGRTQDLVGLGLLEQLAKSPRGWLIEHDDGLRYMIAVMDGAVADYNVAVETRAGGILSAQVHRGQAPGEHHYNRLAAMLEKYFATGTPPWPPEQSALTGELVERFHQQTPSRLTERACACPNSMA